MNFKDYTLKLETLYNQLHFSPLVKGKAINITCNQGVYVFYENNLAIYVGRTNRMKNRISEHCRNSSSHYSASFAFLLAKEEAARLGLDLKKK